MVRLTIGALIVGVLVVSYALLTQPPPPTDALNAPQFDVPAGLADGRSLGSAGAPVTVDIWADFQCPGCRQLATRVEPPVISQFVVPGYARLVFHDAAFQGRKVSASWDESVQAAAASRCAADQGRFWQMHDWLFANWNGENQGAFRQDRLRLIADSAELDMTAYDRCMAVGDKQSAATAETDSATSAGVSYTPTIAINGVMYTGAVTVKDVGDAIMAAAGVASSAPPLSIAP
jgi:protein-disulfide isomerase